MSIPKKVQPFIDHHQATWSQLESLLSSVGRNPTKNQMNQLGLLYRQVSAHFAYAQTYFHAHEITDYLKTLVIRSHNIILWSQKEKSLAIHQSILSPRLSAIILSSFSVFLCSIRIVGDWIYFGLFPNPRQ